MWVPTLFLWHRLKRAKPKAASGTGVEAEHGCPDASVGHPQSMYSTDRNLLVVRHSGTTIGTAWLASVSSEAPSEVSAGLEWGGWVEMLKPGVSARSFTPRPASEAQAVTAAVLELVWNGSSVLVQVP